MAVWGWGLTRELRWLLLFDMLRFPNYPDPFPQNWLLTGGARALPRAGAGGAEFAALCLFVLVSKVQRSSKFGSALEKINRRNGVVSFIKQS